ncbi:MAG TPA: ribosomal protein S18-alanine N-acetyltransferase [Dehalococcoidia bacterium]|nr:ribosomal protein S18-alanine N-acetyltransferase [Dehalococcoidia bacterium]
MGRSLPYYVRLMCRSDIEQVTDIDREAFPTMLPPVNFQRELDNPLAHYVVACEADTMPASNGIRVGERTAQYVAGFAGFWILSEEAHIVNIAVRKSCHRQGVGELLLLSLIELAIAMKASLVTLEVRASNDSARKLYGKYGFSEWGLRKRYYTDNREDAVIMTVGDIGSS